MVFETNTTPNRTHAADFSVVLLARVFLSLITIMLLFHLDIVLQGGAAPYLVFSKKSEGRV